MTRLRQFTPMPIERVADTESSSHIEPTCHWWWPPSRTLRDTVDSLPGQQPLFGAA